MRVARKNLAYEELRAIEGGRGSRLCANTLTRRARVTSERGGRSKRYFKVRPLGLRTLRVSRDALTAMWEGLEPLVQRGS
jgi:hypothetical protein